MQNDPMQTMDTDSPSDAGRPAGFWLRVVARLVDMVSFNALNILILIMTARLHIAGLSGKASVVFLTLGCLFAPLFYWAFFSSQGRQTLGYYVAGLRVETIAGQPLGFWRALGRALINFLSSLLSMVYIGLVDYLMVAFNRRKRTLHDVLSGTQVTRIALPKPAPLALSVVLLPLFAVSVKASDEGVFGLKAYFIPSGSMEETLRRGDRFLVNRLYYKAAEPQFHDIIVFTAPESSGLGGSDFVMRCIGVPGEIIEMRGRQLYRNGKAVPEPYVKRSEPPAAPIYGYDLKIVGGKIYSRDYIMGPDLPSLWEEVGPSPRLAAPDQNRIENAKAEAVPSGQVLMLGDNRNNANDSHAWGFLPRANLKGKAMFIFWPIMHWKVL